MRHFAQDSTTGWATEPLAEFFAALASAVGRRQTVSSAIERAALAMDAEVSAYVADGSVDAVVGFSRGAVPNADLLAVAIGQRAYLNVPGAGRCAVAVARLDDDPRGPGVLLLARSGGQFNPGEINLLRAMARTLGLILWTQRDRLLMNALLTAAKEGVIGVDARGSIVFGNEAAASMLGYAPWDLVGTHAHAMLHRLRAEGAPCVLETCPEIRLVRRRAVREREACFTRRDGTTFPVRYSSSLLRDGGVVLGALIRFVEQGGEPHARP